jgi:ATP-binding cassette, subfamily F, member 3
MLSVNQLSVGFGGTFLFEEISFLVNAKDRIGLVGRNGAGKSTLLKVIAGSQSPTSGSLAYQKGTTIGYLSQDIVQGSSLSVFKEAEKAFEEIQQLEKRMNEITEELGIREDYDSQAYTDLTEELHHCTERYSLLGGHQSEGEIEKVLLGLGFERNDFHRPCNEFSGGWRMRIELARILLKSPDLVLLDEPTNHLDIESIQWLEGFLGSYPGAVMLVSHDRALLDNLTNRTIEISTGKIYDYKTNYSNYLIQREDRREMQLNAKKNQDKYIEHTEKLIDKFRAKQSKAAFAQSLIKKLDKIERVEVDESDNSGMKFRFPPADRAGKVVIKGEGIIKVYGDKKVLNGIDFTVERGSKLALAGRNGEGKSTLIKIIAGVLDYQGVLEPGHNVSIGYFAQNQAELLDIDKTVLDTIDEAATGEMRKKVRTILGSFLFSGDDVFKKVKVLSGGERNRLALCKLLLHPYNLLLLDEPTNHLDIRSKEILKEALLSYDGTFVLVSHDRDFLHGLTDQILYFRNGKTRLYLGDIYDFMKEQKLDSLRFSEAESKAIRPAETAAKQVNIEHQQRKEQEKVVKKLSNKIQKQEEEIAALETQISALSDELSNPELLAQKELFMKKLNLHAEKQKELDQKMQLWEADLMELERMKNQ